MPHVTFVHGIANKPPKDQLLDNWKYYLSAGGLDLDANDVSCSMVYWADVMYPEPEADASSFESDSGDVGTVSEDDDLSWIDDVPRKERAFVDSLRQRLRFDVESPGNDEYVAEIPMEPSSEEQSPIPFEAVPLPWFIKRRAMKRLLKDVYYYLFNKPWKHATSGNEVLVRDHIRELFINQLAADAAGNDGAHVVVGHSMGTVISYDCLKHVDACVPVTAYMTVGSPLGISEVHDNFAGYDRRDAFPAEKLGGGWVNVYDRLDPVAFDARLANDYQRERTKVIIDEKVKNSGTWRHSSWKYFGQEVLCEHLINMLEL
ncbi:MAG: hypothetical protein AAGE01_14850 [Pseudomonadota bacterium]